MSTVTMSGVVADHLGHCMWNAGLPGFRVAAAPGSSYADEHPAPLLVHHNHDLNNPLGHVIHLHREHGALSAVAELDVDPDELRELGELRWSSTTSPTGPGGELVMTELSLTAQPASVGLPPVRWWPDKLSTAACYYDAPRDLLRRAADRSIERRRRGVLVVDDVGQQPGLADLGVTVGPIEHRAAVAVEAINQAERKIDLIAAPYGEVTQAVEHQGRLISEEIVNTAFIREAIENRRVTVNRDHDNRRLIGRVDRLDPFADDGLHATIRVSRTPLGDETLALAADGVLGASVGMGVPSDGQHWDTARRHRRITRALLDHIALVPNPAYPGARVLAVRSNR